MPHTHSDGASPRPAACDPPRLAAAYQTVRRDLLDERVAAGHWVGELSTSALSTATAVSALLLVKRHSQVTDSEGGAGSRACGELIGRGLDWLARHQNSDGGWGDTDKSYSNIATSLLASAAFRLAHPIHLHAELLARAETYIDSQGRWDGLRRRFGRDKTFAVPILTNCALAGMVPWREVAPLPFELACFPQRWYHRLQLPVVSYAIPALVAIGQARFFHRPPRNPLMWLIRRAAIRKSLVVLQQMQPASGGYLEAVPLTSFVVMSLACTGRATHPVARSGVRFLSESIRPDGSWPIDTNLATWNTTLALNGLASGGEDLAALEPACLGWLLGCQQRDVHPFTGAAPGGWGWTDLSGAVPDADDTPGALLALAAWRDSASCPDDDRQRIERAAIAGVDWLLNLQNSDGGWPTFCRGWGKLPFDRSGPDLTAHVLRALRAWSKRLGSDSDETPGADVARSESGPPPGSRVRPATRLVPPTTAARVATAVKRGFAYLERQQLPDGSWIPLWFGNQDHPAEENPVYGTAKVLLALRDHDRIGTAAAERGLEFLKAMQNTDGGWGGYRAAGETPTGQRDGAAPPRELASNVEETSLAVEALLSGVPGTKSIVGKGLRWLVERVEADRHRENSPIGFYFAKLWYHERLYPLTFAASALGRAVRDRSTDRGSTGTTGEHRFAALRHERDSERAT